MADTSNTTDTTDTTDTLETSVPNVPTVPTVPIPVDIDDATFHADVAYLEALLRRVPVGNIDMPIIDIGEGAPIVFVPIQEHLEFVYARQIRTLSQSRRVILYRRREARRRFAGFAERIAELRSVLDALGLQQVDLVGHGDAAMVMLEFAALYPQRCRSLVIIAQAADYQIAPHPFIWLLHEIFLRLPIEHFLPAWFLRRIVINYIVSSRPTPTGSFPSPLQTPQYTSVMRLPRHLIEQQFEKIALWPFVYKFSVLPIIHNFDISSRLGKLTMPILILNRAGDPLSPEEKTRWLADHLPNCAGHHLVPGHERFFMYSQAEEVNCLMLAFYQQPR